jgi:hypothetical protein
MLTTSGMFPHRMRVWRDTGQRDRFGQRDMQVVQTERGIEGMAQTAADIRCRVTTPTGGARLEERSTLVFVTRHTVYAEPNADVNEADRVQVYEPVHLGIIVPDGIITLIKPVYGRDIVHHLEMTLEVIRSATQQGMS